MHTLIGRIMKYVLRVLLILILSFLLVGLIKYRGDVSAYINSLNTRDRRQARGELSFAHPSSFAHMFWGSGNIVGTGDISLLSGEILTGTESTGINAYDPSLEADLNDMSGDSLNNTGNNNETGFGFKQADAETPTTNGTGTSREQLLNLIKQHELKK